MSGRLVTVATYLNAAEARLARAALVGAGIRAVLSNDATSDVLSHVGTALGGVKLIVDEKDAERAVAVLAGDSAGDGGVTKPAGPWNCPQCGEENPAEFQSCWSCQAEYGATGEANIGADADAASHGAAPPSADEGPVDFTYRDESAAAESTSVASRSTEDKLNPYASPLKVAPPPETPDEEVDEEAEATVGRAYRAALIGIILCPPLLNVYSVWLLMSVALTKGRLGPAATRTLYVAWAFNILVGLTIAVIGIFAVRFAN
jgi:hypothetical protein